MSQLHGLCKVSYYKVLPFLTILPLSLTISMIQPICFVLSQISSTSLECLLGLCPLLVQSAAITESGLYLPDDDVRPKSKGIASWQRNNEVSLE